jgi:hypothetical protein
MKKATQLIFNFFIKPEENSFSGQKISGKMKWLLLVLVLEMPFSFAAGLIQQLLFESGLVNSEKHLVNEMVKSNSIFFVIIMLVLFIPFVEELLFRLPLRFKKANFIPLALILLFFAGTLLFNKLHLSPVLSILLFIIIVVCIGFCFFNRRIAEKWGRILSTNYPLYFYGVTILFALVHLSNFTYSVSLLLFAPIIVLPQFVGGFFMGYIRIKQGFIWGFFLHVLHNVIFILPVLLFPSFNTPKLIEKIDKDDYTFEVYEGYHFSRPEFVKSNPTTSASKVTPNEIVLSGTFKYVVSTLTYTNKRYIRFKNSMLAEKEISLYFKNDSAFKQESSKIATRLAFENLLESYNLKVKTEKNEIMVWNILVFNEDLFGNHISTTNINEEGNSVRAFYGLKDTLKLRNINSEFLTKTLRIAFDTENQINIDKDVVFSINIPNDDFNNLKLYLESNYGMTIEKKTEKRDMLVVY